MREKERANEVTGCPEYQGNKEQVTAPARQSGARWHAWDATGATLGQNAKANYITRSWASDGGSGNRETGCQDVLYHSPMGE